MAKTEQPDGTITDEKGEVVKKAPVTPSAPGAQVEDHDDDSPQLTAKVRELLTAAGIEIDERLQNVSDEDLKTAGLNAAQIRNVRAVHGDYEAL